MKKILVLAGSGVVMFGIIMVCPAWASITATFGAFGESGSLWGKEISFNGYNQVFEWNANLNTNGVSNWLTDGAIPGIDFLSTTDIYETYFIQTYTFTNSGSSLLSNLAFYSFLDAKLDGTLWDDMGEHTEPVLGGHPLLRQYDYYTGTSIYLSGIVSSGPGWTYSGQFANSWEIDYSGNVWFDIEDDLLTNAVSPPFFSDGDDYAAALMWNLGNLGVGQSISIRTLVSLDGTQIPPIPEPSTILLLGSGLITLLTSLRGRHYLGRRPGYQIGK